MTELTESFLKKIAGHFDLEGIYALDLSGKSVSRLDDLNTKCPKLVSLDLSRNNISELTGLEGLTDLKKLDLSGNRIREVNDLADLFSLEVLDLSNNSIATIKDLSALAQFKSLKTLHVAKNPICENSSYKEKIKDLIPSLTNIDGDRVQNGLGPVSSVPLHERKSTKSANNDEEDDWEFKMPASVPWTKGFSWDIQNSANQGNQNEKIQDIQVVKEFNTVALEARKSIASADSILDHAREKFT
eukprot:comp17803_c0_seq1/m.30726 comp17803_c0_seq1/g.30726  ORF comp17803_c0_seq1/g.30726 comp17803_c0_seq1/m.30726 type:complete len:244 (+) comp17803_c0_seq1:22-753(+)